MIERVQTLADILRSRYFGSGRVTGCDLVIQEAQLPQRDRATHIYRKYRLRDIMAPHKWGLKTPNRVNRRGSKEVSVGRQGRVS